MKEELLYNPEWNQLPIEEKMKLIRELLKTISLNFQYQGMRTYSLNGISTETALMWYEGSQFVFVPGAYNVQLGWNDGIKGLKNIEEIVADFDKVLNPLQWYKEQLDTIDDESYKTYLLQKIVTLEENGEEALTDDIKQFYTIEGLEKYINENTSPIRIVDIPPMIVEVHNQEAGSKFSGQYNVEIGEHTLSVEDYEKIKPYINSAFQNRSFMPEVVYPSEVTYWKICQFKKSKDNLYDVFQFYPSTIKSIKNQLKVSGFSLPTEDIWEYLCGGGTRTLFPFGNEFDKDYRYKYLNEKNILENPNMFGLQIAYDQYRYEIVDSDCLTKGGDGGGSLCGGMEFIYIMLPLSTFWRENGLKFDTDPLQGGYYYYRRILILD